MNKWMKIGAVVGVIVLCGFWWVSKHNIIIDADQRVQGSYAELQNQMQRQADLIPNLVETVKGSAAFERGAFTDISNARSGIINLKNVDTSNPEIQKKLIEAQAQMSQALVKLNATKEAYPDLKSNTQFNNLMVEITGTQNRVTFARRKTQENVQYFNSLVMKFPGSLAAQGYAPKPYFQASDAAQTAPQVKF